jgi:hypothetical protein
MQVGYDIYGTYSLNDLLHKPVSVYLLHRVVELRNGERNQSCLETFARTVAGEFCFAALGVAAVVECVVRAQLYLIAAIPLLLSEYCLRGAFDRVVLVDLPITLILLPDLVIRCLAGFVKSPFTRGYINMHSLTCCVCI